MRMTRLFWNADVVGMAAMRTQDVAVQLADEQAKPLLEACCYRSANFTTLVTRGRTWPRGSHVL